MKKNLYNIHFKMNMFVVQVSDNNVGGGSETILGVYFDESKAMSVAKKFIQIKGSDTHFKIFKVIPDSLTKEKLNEMENKVYDFVDSTKQDFDFWEITTHEKVAINTYSSDRWGINTSNSTSESLKFINDILK